jgi:hypothetical protein
MRLRLQVKIFMRLLLLPVYSPKFVTFFISVGDPDPDLFVGSGPFFGSGSENFDRIWIPDPTLLKVLIINQKR